MSNHRLDSESQVAEGATQEGKEAQNPLITHSKESLKNVAQGANDLSVGISLVVAVGLGIALGYGMEQLFEVAWLFWLGVAWGVAAAILNLYKAYKRAQKDAEELAKDPRYSYHNAQDPSKNA